MAIALAAIPLAVLVALDRPALERWSLIGQAMEPVGLLFSGLTLFAITVTLLTQNRDLPHQRENLTIALNEQRRQSSEIVLRGLHTDLIRMALDDRELAEVWPPLAPGVRETRKDHYCNLILNLQKVAFEAGTIEEQELRAALGHLMRSSDMYEFWTKVRDARVEITAGDVGEDFFTGAVDQAYAATGVR